MKAPASAKPLSPQTAIAGGKKIWLAASLLILAGIAAWSNSLHAPFVFDDVGTILNNPTLLKLFPPWDAIIGPPGGTTASGRPLVNLSLALNYAIGGFDVRNYHIFNLAAHIAAGLVFFGVVRRTLLRERLQNHFGSVSQLIALACAAVWLLHPLQTAAVTYTVQRAEVLASLFYLLTLYGFLRSIDSPRPLRWQVISFLSCLFGMASKEIVVSAPLFVFLYDRTLAAGSFSAAWKQRRGYYLGLASTWILLAFLIFSTHGRGGSVGSDAQITSWSYALTQCRAIIHYLRLTVWPSALVFDYGTATVSSLSEIWPQALLLAVLCGFTLHAIWKNSSAGLLGAWFFLLLGPSSSFIPVVTQTMAEHRLYLALVAPLLIYAIIVLRFLGRRGIWVLFGSSLLFGFLTFQRNGDYKSAISLWSDTTEKLPTSKRAYNNLGTALFIAGRTTDAIAAFKSAVALDPRYVNALVNLGRAELQADMPGEAAAHFSTALTLDPHEPAAHFGLGFILASAGRLDESIAHYQEAVKLEPTSTDYRIKLAQTLFRARQPAAAILEFRHLIQLAPSLAEAHAGLGTVLASEGQFAEAERELTTALSLNPNDFDAHYNLGNALVQQERIGEAITHYEAAQRLRPNHAGVRQILEQARTYLNASK